MKNISEESLQKKFLQFEEKNSLFSKEISGIFFWKLIRVTMYRNIAYGKKSKSISKKNKFNIFDYTVNSVFFSKEKFSTIVFENPRKVKKESGYYDPYTRNYIDQYLSKNENYQIVDDGYQGIHFEKSSKLRKFNHSFYYDIILKIFGLIFKENISTFDDLMLDDLEKIFDTEFQVSSDLKKITLNQIRSFKIQMKKYGSIYDLKKCKEIYIVCSYGKEGMIHAARIRGIKVNEFQHGIMGPYQMGYHFPADTDIPYFPDQVLLFGELWKDITNLPNIEVNVIGYKHLTDSLNGYLNTKKIPKSVLIISQPSIADRLIPFILQTAKNNSSYKFRYRLHPKEKNDWRDKYPSLTNNSLDNLIIDYSSEDLYSVLSQAEIIIGVSSQTIYECIMLDCNIILVDLPSVDHMSFLIKKSYVKLVSADLPLKFNKESFSPKLVSKEYIYKITNS